MNIILAGMPLSGKTTVLKVFEKRGAAAFDTDAEIVAEHGAITEIFSRFGEEYFRDLETRTVRRLSALDNVIIATGGGCLMRGENVKLFKNGGKIVYLRTRFETLYSRLKDDRTRPLLKGDARGNLLKLYTERTPVYELAADVIIDTDGLTPDETADKITEIVK